MRSKLYQRTEETVKEISNKASMKKPPHLEKPFGVDLVPYQCKCKGKEHGIMPQLPVQPEMFGE